MTPDIERAARALRRGRFARTNRLSSFDETVPPSEAELADATAVLEALAEPSDAAVEAAAMAACDTGCICARDKRSPLKMTAPACGAAVAIARAALRAARLAELGRTEG